MSWCDSRVCFFFVLWICQVAHADALIAVASNFRTTLEALAEHHTAIDRVAYASTGKLIAQIERRAPFDVFLSADRIPARLKTMVVPESEFTYAFGQLALASAERHDASLEDPKNASCIAIANPSVAPYGRAASEAIAKLEQDGWSFEQTIQGQSVAQAMQFLHTRACSLALVSYAQVLAYSERDKIAYRVLPQSYHAPIVQNAALLIRAKGNTSAKAFIDFLKSDAAQSVIENTGYLVSPP